MIYLIFKAISLHLTMSKTKEDTLTYILKCYFAAKANKNARFIHELEIETNSHNERINHYSGKYCESIKFLAESDVDHA